MKDYMIETDEQFMQRAIRSLRAPAPAGYTPTFGERLWCYGFRAKEFSTWLVYVVK